VLSKFREAAPYEPKYANKPGAQAIREFEIDENMDCLLMVKSGGVILRDCQLSLNSLPKRLRSKYPCIVTMPKTFLNMTSCEIIGNVLNFNAAAIFINSHIFISDCTFKDFRAGCIFTLGKPHSMMQIQDSTITNCHVVGVYSQGQGASQQLTRLKMSSIQGAGIFVAKGNQAKIKGCEIFNSRNGIIVVSAQPTVMMCNLYNNQEIGFYSIAKRGLRCDATIKYSTISHNKKFGIVIKGD
jgi:hypothetical protein